jgi:hypothetical protein
MSSLSFTSTVLDEGTTFIFGFWICVANGLGGFNSHLVDSRKPDASTSTRSSDLDKFIDNLDELLLPDLARQIERTSIFDATSTRVAPGLLGSDSNRFEEAMQSKSLSNLEEDLDRLLRIRHEGATACRGALIFDNYSNSNEECPSTTSWSRGGLDDEGATASREAPVLDNHSQPDDYPKLFSGNHLDHNIYAARLFHVLEGSRAL